MKNKSAFTMIELVFVIVILGIIASIAMGRMERDLKQEASETILSHIRLTQQLALRDNKHRSDNNLDWQKSYWQIDFNCTSSCRYIVGSDKDLDSSIDKIESAIDPTDGKYLWNDGSTDSDMSNKVLLEDKFGIHTIAPSAGCNGSNSIAFDYLGRPYISINTASNDFGTVISSDCNLTFTMSTDEDNDGNDDNFTITIKAETGHSFIVGQE
ncbi:Putative periplasmic ATP /GTP-binding protein [hydrothermal vent metagenome]|uniref:Putative periplasmic ATP /GTP-binding protein n=1 Tax=hydrothermal vent metagenome TaxID=652676 RepID=A0A1W1BZA1_9ZZZZ